MIIRTEALSEKQRKELRAYISLPTQIARIVLFVAFVALTGYFLKALQNLVIAEPPLWIIPMVAIAGYVYVRSKRWTGGRELVRAIRQDLEEGVINVCVIKPKSVIEISELEDEGPTYFVLTQDGSVAMFSGQEMVAYKKRAFPWSEFAVEKTPRSDIFFKIRKIGAPIPVERTIPPLAYEDMKRLGCFDKPFLILEKDQVLPFTWDS